MRKLAALMGLVAGLGLAVPAEAEFRAGARIGSSGAQVFIGVGDRAFPRPVPRPHPFPGGDRKFRHREKDWRHRPRPWPYPYYYRSYGDAYVDDPLELPPPPAQPAEPPVAEEKPVEPAPPPDPRGPAIQRARGVPGGAPYKVGEPLPATLPHVTLDWRLYDLPEPPPGRIYARVGRDVLVITAEGRVVERVVPPG